ncbi:hypothetical protein REPUB_Repub03eG0202500 [Reevesia pubescens]
MGESVSITVCTSTVGERMNDAAREGDIEALYVLIREKVDVLREIDQMEFVDTPLHTAAAAGRTEFAMELMDLKPSFVTKLNQYGFSLIHLALQNGNSETKGDRIVLCKFLEDCPECIHDLTNRKETALHLAAMNYNLEAFRVILSCLWSSDCSMSHINGIFNLKNRDGDTVLHIAASNNQPKIVRLLAQYWIIDMKATNSNNLTALGILQGQNQEDNIGCENFAPCSVLENCSLYNIA